MERVQASGRRRGCFVLQPNAVEAHTGFEPVLPEKARGRPDSGSRGRVAPGSELNPHLRAVLERLKERDREKRRR
jgi:hypothetical protein